MLSQETTPAAREAESGPSPLDALTAKLSRYVPLLTWVVVVVTLLMIPGKIISYGYIPMDDALRHAAKVVSGKPWPEIIVMRSEFTIDPHPGWHAVLGVARQVLNLNAEGLVIFSVVGLMLLVNAAVLPWLRRPEMWLASLLLAGICIPRFMTRLTFGRPFIFTIAVFITLVFIWTRLGNRRPRPLELGASVLLIALAAWIHGSWYQLGFPIAALILAGQFRSAIYYCACWFAGSLLGCGFTGHPIGFLVQCVHHLFSVFGDFHVDRQLAAELLPSGGDATAVLAIAAMLLWRSRSPGWTSRELLNPMFLMGVVGWLLGLKVYRFWDDWGLPATLLWFALELQKQIGTWIPFDSVKRLTITLALALGVFLSATSDMSSRYTWNLTNEYLKAEDPNTSEWVPAKGGILYSADMRVFNETFYKNPTAPWRYALGFESGLMKPEDLDVYRKVVWNYGDVRAYEPWVKKMRPEDRLVIRASWLRSGGAPNIPELEWNYAVADLWVGRVPRKTDAPAPPAR